MWVRGEDGEANDKEKGEGLGEEGCRWEGNVSSFCIPFGTLSGHRSHTTGLGILLKYRLGKDAHSGLSALGSLTYQDFLSCSMLNFFKKTSSLL